MQLTGRLIMKGETKTYGQNGFEKREIAISTEEQYPQKILIEFTQQRCDLVSGLKQNDLIKIDINIKGRDWVNPEGETKYFNSIEGWRVEKINSPTASQSQEFTPSEMPEEDEEDELPF